MIGGVFQMRQMRGRAFVERASWGWRRQRQNGFSEDRSDEELEPAGGRARKVHVNLAAEFAMVTGLYFAVAKQKQASRFCHLLF